MVTSGDPTWTDIAEAAQRAEENAEAQLAFARTLRTAADANKGKEKEALQGMLQCAARQRYELALAGASDLQRVAVRSELDALVAAMSGTAAPGRVVKPGEPDRAIALAIMDFEARTNNATGGAAAFGANVPGRGVVRFRSAAEMPPEPFIVERVEFSPGGRDKYTAVLPMVAQLPQLGELRVMFGKRGWSDEMSEPLGAVHTLRNLEFIGVSIGDNALAVLSTLPQLTSLQANFRTGISAVVSDSGLFHLRRMTGLTRLALPNAPITDAGLIHLKGLKQLENLNLAGTKVTAAGVARLQAHLPDCTIVTDKNLQ